MGDPYRTPDEALTLKTAREWFDDADRRFRDAMARVMTARTSAHPFTVDREIDWSAFREEMANLHRWAEERHAAKHAATREAMLRVPIICAVLDKSEDPKP